MKHILVPLDGSSFAECVLPHALAFAKAFNAPISLVHVLEQPSASLGLAKADALDWYLKKSEINLYLDSVKIRLEAHGAEVQTLLLEGRASEKIVDFAQNSSVDLLILSDCGKSESSGKGLSSTIQQILYHVRTSTLLVRSNQPATVQIEDLQYHHILAPLDGSQRAGSVLAIAVLVAQAHQAELALVHVVSKPEMARHMPLGEEDTALINRFIERNQEEGNKYLEQIHARLPVSTQCHLLLSDNVAASLQNFSEQEQIDLIILSAHGYSGEAKWPYGSITNRFITSGTSSLLIVQDLPQEFNEAGQTKVETRQLAR